MTGGYCAHSVIEAVGTQESMLQVIRSARPGGHVSCVGVARGVQLSGEEVFYTEVHDGDDCWSGMRHILTKFETLAVWMLLAPGVAAVASMLQVASASELSPATSVNCADPHPVR